MTEDHGDIEEGGPVMVRGVLREVVGGVAVVEFPLPDSVEGRGFNVAAVPLHALRAAGGTQ